MKQVSVSWRQAHTLSGSPPDRNSFFAANTRFAVGHIWKQFPFFSEFDGYFLSYEHGAMKPEAKFHEVVGAKTGRHGTDILSIDDRLGNMAAGAARSWQTVLLESSRKTRAALENAGLLKPKLAETRITPLL